MSCPLRLALPPGVIASGPLLRGILYPSLPAPAAPQVEVVSISSLTGDGELVGWSEYSHPLFAAAAPIKYRSRTLTGALEVLSYTGLNGTGSIIYSSLASYPYPATGSASARWTGTAQRDETGLINSAARYDTGANWAGFLPESAPVAVSDITNTGIIEALAFSAATTATVKTLNGVGSVNDTRQYAPRGSYVGTGSAAETLSSPDTIYAALLRGTALEGTLESTLYGSVTDTAPETYSPQPFTGFTAVRVTGRLRHGGTPGVTYGVRVGLARAQIMPPFLSYDSAWIEVTATGAETLFTYDVPVTPNFLTRFTGFFL